MMAILLGDSKAKLYLGDTPIFSGSEQNPLPVMNDVAILLYSEDYNPYDMSWNDNISGRRFEKGTSQRRWSYVSNGGVYSDSTINISNNILTTGFTIYIVGAFTPNRTSGWTALLTIMSSTNGTDFNDENGAMFSNGNNFLVNGLFEPDARSEGRPEYVTATPADLGKACFVMRFTPENNFVEAIKDDGTVAGTFTVTLPSTGIYYRILLTTRMDDSISGPNSTLLAVAVAYSAHTNEQIAQNLQFLRSKYGIT